MSKRRNGLRFKRNRRQRFQQRRPIFECLEPRLVLNGVPIANNDPWYFTPQDVILTVSTSDTTLLENDWDPEGDSLAASIVDQPANGMLLNLSSDGTFTYMPNYGFTGFDSFSYKVNDGTADSDVATVSIAVGGHFGPRTNQEERTRAIEELGGDVLFSQTLTPAIELLYNSRTIPDPIVVVETSLLSSSSVPDEIQATLEFNSVTGATYEYDTASLSAGDALRFAVQADGSSLGSGRYEYSLTLDAIFSTATVSHIYSGRHDVVSRDDSTHAFGRGWQLAGLDELVVEAGGVLWVQSAGDALWFAEDGSGGFERADGDPTFSTLGLNGGSYTLTDKSGNEKTFDSAGALTSLVDRNGNTTSYTYTAGLLTTITDPFGRETTFSYIGGQLSSVTDFANRTAGAAYDASGRLTSITQPDPDGAGPLEAPVWSFAYDTSHRLTQMTNPLSNSTQYGFGSHGKLQSVTHPDSSSRQLTSLQTIGLPTGATGNLPTPANPEGTSTDERGGDWKFRTDRFGNVTSLTNPLGHVTLTERDRDGLPVRRTEPDPDGAGSLSAPVTTLGYDALGNLVYEQNPDATTKLWTYTASNSVASATDELSRTVSFFYDASGNLTTQTDPDGNSVTISYNGQGQRASVTLPDPDGAGPLTTDTTSYAYDGLGRLTTQTNPDSTTQLFVYDSANNLTSETDELGNDTVHTYDALGRRTNTTDRENATTSWGYDALGKVTQETDALGYVTDFEYNSRGWLTKKTGPDPDGAGPLDRPEWTYVYDAGGNRTSFGGPTYLGTQLTFIYDGAGRLVQQDGPVAGRTTTYTYDNLGRRTKTTDALSRDTEYEYNWRSQVTKETLHDPDGPGGTSPPVTINTYDAAGQLTQLTDPRGYTTSYGYNARGQRSSLVEPDPDGSGPKISPTTTYVYDTRGRLIEHRDVFENKTTHEYDWRGQLTKTVVQDTQGAGPYLSATTTRTYDNAGRMVTSTDPLSRTTIYTYDNEGRIKTTTEPDPDGAGPIAAPVTTVAYDAIGNVVSHTDAAGNVTTFEYDSLGRQTKATQPDPDEAGPQVAPVTIHEYGVSSQLEKTIDPGGAETTFQYDGMGRRIGVTDHLGNQTTYAYNPVDKLTSETAPDPDGAGPLLAPVTTYEYDDYDRLKTVTKPESGVTTYTFDAAGNLLTLTDPVGNTTTWAYDGLGRVTFETNELNKTRSRDYDFLGNPTRKTDRNGHVTQFTYDTLRRLIKEEWFENGSTAPVLSVVTDVEGGKLDEVQRVGFTATMISGGTFTVTVDGATTSPLAWNASTATVQSALEGLASVGSGNVLVAKLNDSYDHQEWQLTFQNGNGATNLPQTTIETSGLYAMPSAAEVEATDTDGGSSDEQQTVTLSNTTDGTFRLAFQGETTAPLDWDAAASEVRTALEELNSVDQVAVTGAGPWTVTFVGSHTLTNVGQLVGDAATLANGSLIATFTYAYDTASQLTSASGPSSSYAYSYDELGRVLTVDNAGTLGVPNVVLTSVYDVVDNRTKLFAKIDGTDDFLNSYTYDALGRLTRLDQTEQAGGNTVAEKRVDFTYNARGQFDTIARYNDTEGNSGDEIATSSYTYDTLGRLNGLAYENDGTDLFTPYAWSYDALNRITQFTSQDGTSDYTYDATSQLTFADHSYQGDESYSYDANGNRTNTGYSTATNNQLGSDGTYSYEYDDEGNRTKRTDDTTGEVTEYEWDYRNRLAKVTSKDSNGNITQVVEYIYDVFNRRISRAVDATAPFDLDDASLERYIYDDHSGVASKDGGNAVLDFSDPDGEGGPSAIQLASRQLFGDGVDQILAQEDVFAATSTPDRVLWHLADNLATVRDLIKNDGTLSEHYTYDSFGQLVLGNTSYTRYLYTSREYDPAVGMQYNRARWYDAGNGVWIGQDPLGFAGLDTNLARYVANNPVNLTDPSGELAFIPFLIVGVAIVLAAPTYANAPAPASVTYDPLTPELATSNAVNVIAVTGAAPVAKVVYRLATRNCFVNGTLVHMDPVDDPASADSSNGYARATTILAGVGLTVAASVAVRRRRRSANVKADSVALSVTPQPLASRAACHKAEGASLPAVDGTVSSTFVDHVGGKHVGKPTLLRERAWIPVWLGVWLLLSLSWNAISWRSSVARSSGTTKQPIIQVKPIEDVRLGDSVLTDISDQLREAARAEIGELPAWDNQPIQPAVWRAIDMAIKRNNGTVMEVRLLRPLEWLEQNHVTVGGEIYLSLPEMQQYGWAHIERVGPCPRVQSTKGSIVTGTFASTVRRVLEIHTDCSNSPILSTAEHPFFRVDDKQFVPADQLCPGDHIQQLSGIGCIEQVVARTGSFRVHNLEVHGSHVFRVSEAGVLVHNTWNPEPVNKAKEIMKKFKEQRKKAEYWWHQGDAKKAKEVEKQLEKLSKEYLEELKKYNRPPPKKIQKKFEFDP